MPIACNNIARGVFWSVIMENYPSRPDVNFSVLRIRSI